MNGGLELTVGDDARRVEKTVGPSEGRAAKSARAPITPLIVEEKPICRHAIADLVSEVALTAPPSFASSLSEALKVAGARAPDLLLVDLFSVSFDFDGLRRLILASRAPAVAIDDRPNPSFAGLARMAGAQGYASKNYELDTFRAVIRAVIEGGAHFPRETSAARQRRTDVSGPSLGLSPRQMDVLKCIAVGMSNQQIATSLGITLGTVKLHIHAILRLTGTRNRTEAALIAGRFLAPTIED
ncbi:response regulator transcription factor [Phenylobacterium sp.]|uniref:LuxR C-terminal-related transcriptional regulator n=1 Tax=Phenylobacterium sp. TaxID=1871053 RepID=UPI0025E59F11|nr:response regulator transcription factor [Phenylobacterium sp.]